MHRLNRIALVVAAIIAAVLAFSFPSDATAPDLGVRVNYGRVPLVMPWTTFKAHATLGAYAAPFTVLGDDWSGAIRGEVLANLGGEYSGSHQTAYPGGNFNVTMRTQGQALGAWVRTDGYGKGNATPINAVSTCYGGGETPPPSSTPECSGLGEAEADQGTLIWDAALAAPYSNGATTLHFTNEHNAGAIGARTFFNLNHIYATDTISAFATCTDSVAGACSVTGGTCPLGAGTTCTVITFVGGTLPSNGHQWYLKLGAQNDWYHGACAGNDVPLTNGGAACGPTGPGAAPCCVAPTMYKVSRPDSTHLITHGAYDTTHLGTFASTSQYLMVEGIEATAVDAVAKTITIPSNTFTWAATDYLYSPPNFYMGITGLNLIFRPQGAPAGTDGVRVLNAGPARMQNGILIEGAGGGNGGFYTAISVRNMNVLASRASGDTTQEINNTRGIDFDSSFNRDIVCGADGSFSGGIPSNVCLTMGANGNTLVYGDASKLHFLGTPISVDTGVAGDGGGKKHKRVTTGSISSTSTADVTVTWTTSFADSNYTVNCPVEETSGVLTSVIRSHVAASVLVNVKNTSGGALTGTLNCLAEHD